MHEEPDEARQDSKPPRSMLGRYLLVVSVLLTASGGVVWYAVSQRPTTNVAIRPDDAGRQLPDSVGVVAGNGLPKVASTRFRNASKDVAYVGNRACVECHAGEHKSYLATTHSRALATIDVSREPPDAEFHHKLSARHYRVYRKGEQLRHREFIHDADGKEVVLADHAMKYAVGSGNFSRSYLLDIDGFLFESPLTWYASDRKWRMSPGYDNDSHQSGFSRPVDRNCMQCHSGQVETVNQGYHRLQVNEMAISCERCHGPGELHVRERQAKLPIKADFDDTIVNLRHLSRARQEDVCAQCHLASSADVNVRGRNVADFRPGMRMADFVVGFRADTADPEMTVVGHVDQMKLSRCYTESKSMTCTTCHDPHAQPDAAVKVSYFKNKCFECHQTESCKEPVKTRLQKQPNDNCIACHMPRGPTDIPHFAFTHHRVGIHKDKPAKSATAPAAGRLIPIADISHFPPLERDRLMGLALKKYSQKLKFAGDNGAQARTVRERSRRLLEDVLARGVRDPETEMELSLMYWRRDPRRCTQHAQRALEATEIDAKTRRYALHALATSHIDLKRFDLAYPVLKKLLEAEHNEISLMLMATYHRGQGNLPEAERLAKQAIRITPYRADLHVFLASVYRLMEKPELAKQHSERAKLLERVVPQPST